MPFLKDLNLGDKIFALFISRSGAGKTTAAASFPNPIFLDFDGRIRGLLGSPHIDIKKIFYEQFLPGEDNSTWDKFDEQLTSAKTLIKNRQFPYETLILDSLTSFTNLMLLEGMRVVQNGRSFPGKSSLRIPGPGDYLYESMATKQALDKLRTLSRYMNVIVKAHIIPRYGKPVQRTIQGEKVKASDGEDIFNFLADSEEVGEKLAIRDKLGEDAKLYFDEIYRFEKVTEGDQNKHWIDFDTDMARSAIGFKGKEDITGKNFHTYWKEKVNLLGAANKDKVVAIK